MTIDLTFAALIPPLSETRAVIAVEQQGHGRTGDRETPITLESMRADTLGVLDHLGVDRVHVVGFSMGGMLGLDLAVHAPERVASLTAISASQNVDAMLPEIKAMNVDPAYQPSPEVAALMPSEDDFAAMHAAFAENNPSGPEAFGTVMEKLQALITGDWGWSDDELAGIAAPVLLVAGDRDFMPAEHVASMAATVPGARLAILPDTTHLDIMTRTDLLLPMIEARIPAVEEN
jgi:pimeloyl-ACP methyl ester carboxylesterase